MSPKYDYNFNFLLVGDVVGKSCLVSRFVHDTFPYYPLGVDRKVKTVKFEDKIIRLCIWDMTSIERFRSARQSIYERVRFDGIIVVYDVTDERSFHNLKEWFKEINPYVSENVSKVLIGNKCDAAWREVIDYTAKEYADQLGIPFFEASALTGARVEEAFMTLVAEVKTKMCPPPSDADAVRETGVVRSVMRYLKRKSVRVSRKESTNPKNTGKHSPFTSSSANLSEGQTEKTSVTDDIDDSLTASSTNSFESLCSVTDDSNHLVAASSLNLSEDHPSVTDDINDLFEKRKGADVTFALEAPNVVREIEAHQLVLAMRSPYFADEFYGKQRNERAHRYISLKGFCPQAFQKMIRYCYDHKPSMKTTEEACALMKVAAEFKVMTLLNVCRTFLRYTKIEARSVFSVLEISEKVEDDSLRDMCHKVLEEQTKEVLASYELRDITPPMVRIILYLPKLSLGCEYELIKWMFDWAKLKSGENDSNSGGIRKCLEKFLQDMDFLSLTNKEFTMLCQDNSHFFSSAEMASIFLNIALPGAREMPYWHNKMRTFRLYVGSEE